MIEGLQQTNISFDKGIVRTPSLGQEGELSECVNLIPKHGEMVRIREPRDITDRIKGNWVSPPSLKCLHYTLLVKEEILYFVVANQTPLETPVALYLKGGTEKHTQLPTNKQTVCSFEVSVASVDDIERIDVGGTLDYVYLENEGYMLKAYKLFEFSDPDDVQFPTEEETHSFTFELQEHDLIVAVNRCEEVENYIVKNPSELAYYRPGIGRQSILSRSGEDIDVATLGQTLIVTEGYTKRYFMWQDGGYKEQGLHESIPRVELSLGEVKPFKANADRFTSSAFDNYKDGFGVVLDRSGYQERNVQDLYVFEDNAPGIERNGKIKLGAYNADYSSTVEQMTNRYFGMYNQIRAQMMEDGTQCFPFYVRWGLKLYDGTIMHLSAPILMMPSSIIRPAFGCWFPSALNTSEIISGINAPGGGSGGISASVSMSLTPLLTPRYLYAAIDASSLRGIDDSLIQGIVIYATPEIEVTKKEFTTSTIGLYPTGEITDGLGTVTNRVVNINSTGATPSPNYINCTWVPDAISDDDLVKSLYTQLTSPSDFFELMQVPFKELKDNNYKVVCTLGNGCFRASTTDNPSDWTSGGYTDPDSEFVRYKNAGYSPYFVSRNNLKNLTGRSSLNKALITQTDEYVISQNCTYNYNSRLIYGGAVTKTNPNLCIGQILGDSRNTTRRSGQKLSAYLRLENSYLTLKQEEHILKGFAGETPVVIVPNKGTAAAWECGDWQSVTELSDTALELNTYRVWTLLQEYHIRDLTDLKSKFMAKSSFGETWKQNNHLKFLEADKRPNTVAVTKVSNPWAIEQVIELACGSIYAISSTTEAVSEGQFGVFPLLAFTDNGVYALTIDETGKIEAKQALSREVFLEGNKVLQTDNNVVFSSSSGLMRYLGNRQIECISKQIGGFNVDEGDYIQPLDGLLLPDTIPFEKQISEAVLVYDYAQSKIHAFHSSGVGETNKVTYPVLYESGSVIVGGVTRTFYEQSILTPPRTEAPQKHYVYDLESGQWATQILDKTLRAVVPGYPFSTMQFGNRLYQYDNTLDTETVHDGWFLTRPIAFDDPFTRKMLYDVRMLSQKTHKDSKHSIAVYVSNDRQHWARLTSLKSSSAKWYRFLVKATMNDLDTLSGIACQYVPRLGGKLR